MFIHFAVQVLLLPTKIHTSLNFYVRRGKYSTCRYTKKIDKEVAYVYKRS